MKSAWLFAALLLSAAALAQGPGLAKPKDLEARALPGSTAALADGPELAKPKDLKARALPGQAQLGEPFVYELTVTHDPSERWEIEKIAESEGFEFGESSRERVDSKGVAVTTFKVKFQLFELGTKKLPDLTFTVATGVAPKTFTAPGIDVTGVASISEEEAKNGVGLYDIKPNADVPVRTWRLIYALLIAIAVGLLSYYLYKYFTRPKPPPVVAPVIQKPLTQRTLERLDALKAEDLPNKARSREFYFRLSEIVRGYLGERYAFEALEATGSELLVKARGLNAQGLSLDALSRFVADSDLAKFAKFEPSAESCAASLQYAYRLVHDTVPSAAPTQTQNAIVNAAPRPPVQ